MEKIEISDFLKYSFPNGVAYNPSGSAAALVMTRPNGETNDYDSELWVWENGELAPAFPLDAGRKYIWDDDENVLLLKKTAGGTAVLIGNIHSRRVRALAEFPLEIRELAKLRSGALMAVCLTDALEGMDTPDYQVLDELPFCKNGLHGSICKKRNAIFILDLTSGAYKRVTDRLFQTERWCVDGDTIYFNGSAYDKKLCVFQELWSYALGDESPRCLYNGGEYNMRALTMWNGHLMLLGNTNPNVKLFHSEFYTVDKESGEIASFCKYDRSIRSYVTGDCAFGEARVCQSDGEKLYFVSTLRNEARLMALEPSGEVVTVVRREGAVCDFDVRNGEVFLTALWEGRPLECYSGSVGGTLRRVSDLHGGVLRDKYVAVPRPHSFMFDGWEIDGWALEPKDYDPAGSYPAILDIHGGPNACYSEAYCHEMQVWAGRGFFVIFCNPVGSEGRGDDFMDIHGHFGERDYECLMRFTDEMLEKYPQIDRSRLCVTGGSYGGFMTNWIITHTHRFAAAATQRSIANWLTTTLLCDNGWYNMPPQMKADVRTGAERLWAQSPLKYIDYAETPTLVLHSDEDYSVPCSEGLQMFSALIDKGVDARMVRFKGENHELSRSGRPLHRMRRIQEITDWLEAHI